MVFFMGFNYVGIVKACCGRVAWLQWSQIALPVIDCVFMLVSKYLGYG